jgi:primosomal protein N' (replication factor Y) (superfamily II helicase)
MKIVTVLPLKKSILKGDLTYFTNLNITVGRVVCVPIRNKQTLALVISVKELKEMKGNIKGMDFSLRKVIKDKGNSVFLEEFLDAIFDTAKYFAQNKNNVLASLIPNIFIEAYDKLIHLTPPFDKLRTPLSLPRRGAGGEVISEKLLFQYPLLDRISIYKTLVRESFAKNKSIFIVAPTQFDIEKFTHQLSKGVEQFTFSMHSGISPKKNLTTYEKIMTETHPVLIIGTPPFLAVPKKDIGTIILEHENSNAYKMIARPYLDLRVFVEIYASKINAKFILADEILRYQTIERKELDNFNPLYPLSFRVDFKGEIEIQNPRPNLEALPPSGGKASKFKIFADRTIEEIKFALENKKNVFIFSLRKGLATMTLCKDCQETISCKKCGAPLVLYVSHQGGKRMFVCNRCQTDIDGDIACPACGSWNLLPLGIGTDTVFEEVKKLLPKTKIFQLDKGSAKDFRGARKIINEFEENSGSVLVGTEMTFFYLKNKVPLSVIASFDSLWSIPNFKMGEKIIQIILSVIGNSTEKVIIQTKNENDPAITAIKTANLLSFVRGELEDRHKLSYPPYKRFIKITYRGDKEQTIKAKKALEEIFKEYSPLIFSGFVTKNKNQYVTNALIKIAPKKWSLPELSINSSIDQGLFNLLYSLPSDYEVSVDPEDLF